MAVIESKGDGFSLFNGVKLPSLPEWDKTVYPYAMIYDYESIRNTLIVSTIPLSVIVSAGRVTATAECYTRLQNKSDESPWVLGNETARAAGWKINGLPIWSNYDIINTDDNSVYLSASEPISLDGMNVIEWDGDTTGLEQITSTTLYDINVDINLDSTKGYVRRTASGAVKQGSWTVMPEFYNGSNVRVIVDDGSVCLTRATSNHVDLFAYYPIKEEPEETDPISYIEYMANPKYRKYPFRGFFGWLWQRK